MLEYRTYRSSEELYKYLPESDIKFFNEYNLLNGMSWSSEKYVYFCCFDNNKIVGVLSFREDGCIEMTFPEYGFRRWLSYVSVNNKYRNRGIASHLIEYMFQYCKKKKYDKILISEFTPQGWCRIKRVIERLSDKYGVNTFITEYLERK